VEQQIKTEYINQETTEILLAITDVARILLVD
jgi:hypothetical protein